MHPCLCVDEIVRLITSELVAARKHATTVALACCQKDFEDPVLDVLWETQCRLILLLKTLPGGVWGPDGYEVSVAMMALVPPYSLLDLKDLSEAPDDTGMGPFAEVCSKNARALRIR